MTPSAVSQSKGSIIYPESDGKPMADNTRQFQWIVMLADNLSALFHDRVDVFVCGNQNWYPVEGQPEIVSAPDVYVVFGRPKGHRGSYKQWEEGGLPMTVVFEVLSPGNSGEEMIDKFSFYDEYGVEEYYIYNPDKNRLTVYIRRGEVLSRVRKPNGWTSPRLGIRFDLSGPELIVRYPDGRPFLTFEQVAAERLQAVQRAKLAEQLLAQAEQHTAQSEQRATRTAELALKAMRQAATPEEMQELQRLLPAVPSASDTSSEGKG